MLVDEAVAFFRDLAPFNLLGEEALGRLAGTVSLEYYPAGYPILIQGGPPSDALQVVVAGRVKVSIDPGGGGEIVLGYRAEGEVFGYLSLASGDHARTSVTAIDDTTCYLIPRAAAVELLDGNAEVRAHFHRAFLARYVDKAFADMRNRCLLAGGGERLLFTTPVGELATRTVVTAARGVTIQEAAETMSRHRIASLVIVDDEGAPVGLVTDRDLRDKVTARGRSTDDPVSSVMATALIKADAMDYCFEALLKMLRHGIHHLLVVDHGSLAGIVSTHDLMLLQGTSPVSVVREIEGQQGEAGLAAVAGKVAGVVRGMFREGARAGHVMHVLAEIGDRIVRKTADLAERRLGPAPLPWAWLACGAPGRGEAGLRWEAGGALVHADPATPAEEAAAREWFPRFAAEVVAGLERCGFAAAAGDAPRAPARCLPLEGWKTLVDGWVAARDAAPLRDAPALIDHRAVAGETGLGDDLRDHLTRRLRGQEALAARLAADALRRRPPVGLFGRVTVPRSGPRRGRIDVEEGALGPLVDLVRVCAVEAGVPETSTAERLRALERSHPLLARHGAGLGEAFELLAGLALHRQEEQLRAGLAPDGLVDPGVLPPADRRSLREALWLVARLQSRLASRHRAGLGRG